MNITADLAVIRPELFVAVAAMGMLMFGAFRKENSARFVSWLGVGVFVGRRCSGICRFGRHGHGIQKPVHR